LSKENLRSIHFWSYENPHRYLDNSWHADTCSRVENGRRYI